MHLGVGVDVCGGVSLRCSDGSPVKNVCLPDMLISKFLDWLTLETCCCNTYLVRKSLRYNLLAWFRFEAHANAALPVRTSRS